MPKRRLRKKKRFTSKGESRTTDPAEHEDAGLNQRSGDIVRNNVVNEEPSFPVIIQCRIIHGFQMNHGSGKDIENALPGIESPGSDSRALPSGFFPLPYRSYLAEPERISPALERPDRVNPAALIIEPAGAVRSLDDAEPGRNRLQMHPDQIGCSHLQKIRQNCDFPSADADDAGGSRAARAAAPAFEVNAVIKKIPGVIMLVGVAFHMGYDL